jgi:hypothetical protein
MRNDDVILTAARDEKSKGRSLCEHKPPPTVTKLRHLLGGNGLHPIRRLLFNCILEMLRRRTAMLHPIEGENSLLRGWNVLGCDKAVAWKSSVFAHDQDRQRFQVVQQAIRLDRFKHPAEPLPRHSDQPAHDFVS